MNRLLVPRSELSFPRVRVGGERHAYLRDVLRLRPQSPLEVFDGEGSVWPAVLVAYGDGVAELELGEEMSRPFSGVAVTLWQGLPKGDKLELVIQKAVELGVRAVRPIACERSVVRLDAKKAQARGERWQKIADEAARQSMRADTALVEPLTSFADAMRLPRHANERRLMLDEEERAVRLRERFGQPTDHHVVLIGPEGGLTREEAAQATDAGFIQVTLGARVLRTETAGIAVLALLQHALGDLG